MHFQSVVHRAALVLTGIVALALGTRSAQAQSDVVTPVDLAIGRSYPISTPAALSKASVAAPDIADVVVINPHELVVNAKTTGETDLVLWLADGQRQHYRISVKPAANQKQIAVYVKFAEVRRDLLRTIGVSGVYRDAQGHERIGTGIFNTDNAFGSGGTVTIPGTAGFLTVLTDLNTKRLLAFLDVEEQKGKARTLAEPNVLTSNREEAKFLAGGEIPIPVVQGVTAGASGNQVTIQWKEFGVKLRVTPEIINDTLVKLAVEPEVSSLDFNNAIELSGFRIPAFQTRRIATTVDVRHDQSLIISGMFNDSRELVKTGVPLLQDIPILGQLFSSTRWQRNESELLVVVTPVIVDPLHPRPQDILPILPDTALPARGAIQPRLSPSPRH